MPEVGNPRSPLPLPVVRQQSRKPRVLRHEWRRAQDLSCQGVNTVADKPAPVEGRKGARETADTHLEAAHTMWANRPWRIATQVRPWKWGRDHLHTAGRMHVGVNDAFMWLVPARIDVRCGHTDQLIPHERLPSTTLRFELVNELEPGRLPAQLWWICADPSGSAKCRLLPFFKSHHVQTIHRGHQPENSKPQREASSARGKGKNRPTPTYRTGGERYRPLANRKPS